MRVCGEKKNIKGRVSARDDESDTDRRAVAQCMQQVQDRV